MKPLNQDFLKQLEKLKLVLEHKINAQMTGQKESVHSGEGLIFKDRVQYSPGDDIRHVDWRVYGRTNKLLIRRYEAEKNLSVHILVDYSGSMIFGTKMSKHSYAAMIALGFAYLAHRDGERFTINTFSDSIEPVKPRRGSAQLASMFEYLNEKKPSGKTSYTKSLERYAKGIESKSMVVVISDFLYDVHDIEEALFAFKKNQLIVVQVLDPTERDLDLEGDLKLTDLETAEVIRTFVTGSFRQDYHNKLEHHISKIDKVCDSIGARFFSLTVGDPVFDFFYALFKR